jgi:hypothetical protein
MSDSPEPDGQIALFLARWFGRSYRTSIAGGLAILCTLASLLPALKPYHDVLSTVAVALGGAGLMTAKDSRVSGRPNG